MKALNKCQRCQNPVYIKIPSIKRWWQYTLYKMGLNQLNIHCNKCKAARKQFNVK